MRKLFFLSLVTLCLGIVGCSGGDEGDAGSGKPAPTDAQAAGNENKPMAPNN